MAGERVKSGVVGDGSAHVRGQPDSQAPELASTGISRQNEERAVFGLGEEMVRFALYVAREAKWL